MFPSIPLNPAESRAEAGAPLPPRPLLSPGPTFAAPETSFGLSVAYCLLRGRILSRPLPLAGVRLTLQRS
jgi:hypothetical protein